MVMVDRGKMFQMLQEVARHSPDPTIAAEAKVELLDRFATWDPAEGIRLGEEVLLSDADEAMKKQARRWMFYAYMAQGEVEQAQQMFGQVMSDGWTDGLLTYMLNASLRGAALGEGDGAALGSWLIELSTKEGALSAEALRLNAIVTAPWEVDGLMDGDAGTLLATGGALLASGNYDLAEAVGMRCLEQAQSEDYTRAAKLIAKAKAARGEYYEAAECIRDALESNPGLVTAAEWAIQVPEYLRLGGYYDEALAAYQQIVTQYPDSVAAPRALYLMGETHRMDLDAPEVAWELYELIVSEYPDSLYADHAREQLDSMPGT
jgi:tetratricopeptide (TPR) repeat protein